MPATDFYVSDPELQAAEEGLAIVCNGDTAPTAIASGKYLFIKNHSTLATGGYHATAAIASGETLSASNVEADSDGIANGLAEQIGTKYTWPSTLTFVYYWVTSSDYPTNGYIPHPNGIKPKSASVVSATSPGHYSTTGTVNSIGNYYTSITLARSDAGSQTIVLMQYEY